MCCHLNGSTLTMDEFQVSALFMCLLTVGFLSPVQGSICNLQIDTTSTDECGAVGFRAYPAYTCRPCGVSGGQEVHIINLHKSMGGYVHVNIDSNHSVTMKLILASHQTVHWKIQKLDFVEISKVVMMSVHHDDSSVTLMDGGYLHVASVQRSNGLMSDAGVLEYAATHLGRVTSYSTVHQTCSWWLRVGNCGSSTDDQKGPIAAPDLIWTPPNITHCKGQLPCWVKFDFHPTDNIDRCTGDRKYVTWYRIEHITYYIGAILCYRLDYRYSLFLSTSLQDEFLDISDSHGRGEDHCELVGMDKENLPNVQLELENTYKFHGIGYSRDDWGGAFRKADPVKPRPWWYECGITIPDAEKLYAVSESSSFNVPLCVAIVILLVIIGVVAIVGGRCWWRRRRVPDLDNQPGADNHPPGYQDAITCPLAPDAKVEEPPPAYTSL